MSFANRYGWADKSLHRIAFAAAPALAAVGDLESRTFADRLAKISSERPLFITALPRAGTTILLNLLVHSGRFASHTYRDMPFVLCPLLWQRFAKRFQKSVEAEERAHGDGIKVSADSPEAFEEMIWRVFFANHYRKDRIIPWSRLDDEDFAGFLRLHAKKVIALRGGEAAPMRYVSKNNFHIARLEALSDVFPDAVVLVPFREPIQHAASLLKQHRHFLALHAEDRFARAYMAGTGHFDFGENFLPIDFDEWLGRDRRREATDLSFWLEYWIAAYTHLSTATAGRAKFVSYDSLAANPRRGLEWLAEFADLPNPRSLIEAPETLHPPRTHETETTGVAPHLLDSARSLFSELQRLSVFRA
jgi:hypothetical protein